jgi:formylglycine-generating enzyme required for sulfatase activity
LQIFSQLFLFIFQHSKSMKKHLLSILALLPLTAALLLQPACVGKKKRFLEFEPALISVEGGTFEMGYKPDRDGDDNSGVSHAKPLHKVTVSSFRIGKYEVTQAQWEAVMGSNPSRFKKVGSYPVEQVSYSDIQQYLEKLNALTGKQYRLPTEAEWEYAARGGSKSKGYLYSGGNTLSDVAWYLDNSGDSTHAVGTKSPNELGIYDMTGNVWEWCNDWYSSYSDGAVTNPTGPTNGFNRVIRGASWYDTAATCCASDRYDSSTGSRSSHLGFRVALP